MREEVWVEQQHNERHERVKCNKRHHNEVEVNNLGDSLLTSIWGVIVER